MAMQEFMKKLPSGLRAAEATTKEKNWEGPLHAALVVVPPMPCMQLWMHFCAPPCLAGPHAPGLAPLTPLVFRQEA